MKLVVISYDISHPRRLRRIARVLEGYGERVQESVFECWLTREKLVDLQQTIGREMSATEDQVRYYAICEADARDAATVGKGAITRDRSWVGI